MMRYGAFLYTLYIFSGKAYVSNSDCITWHIDVPHLILVCRTNILELDVHIIDPKGIDVAFCSSHVCALTNRDGKIQQNQETKETTYTTSLDDNTNGQWICRHGNTNMSTNVSTSEGHIESTQVHIHGEITTINRETIVKLFCSSCWQPVDHNVEFFVNNVSKDNVRFFNAKCYYSNGECTLEKCICGSMRSSTYGWTYKDKDLVLPLYFSCEMRFKDNFTDGVFKKRATVEFNGKDFVRTQTVTNIVVPGRIFNVKPTTEVIHETHTEDDYQLLILITSTAVCCVLIITVLLVIYNKKITQMQRTKTKPAFRKVPVSNENQHNCTREVNGRRLKNTFTLFSCTTCHNITSYAYCLTCSRMKCESCTTEHTKKYEDHKVIQIADTRLPLLELYCAKCKSTNPETICIQCNQLFCDAAGCRCKHHCMPLVVVKAEYKSSESSVMYTSPDHTIKLLYTVEIDEDKQPTRIRGVELLSRSGFAVLDYGNWSIKVYRQQDAYKTIKLKNEPRAMVRISHEKLAVTYAYQRQIVVVDVYGNRSKLISLKRIGKPYSIAYMDERFAVETGEGEDGMIVIVNMKGEEMFRIENIESICFFTGNTIRLALDLERKVIYASSMGRDEVVCINFESKEIIWKKKVPSPRGIIVVRTNIERRINTHSDTTVLLASKDSDTVYKLNSETGEKDVVMDETNGIKSPRYMSYFQTDNECILAIDMGNASIGVFRAQFSTPLLQTTIDL